MMIWVTSLFDAPILAKRVRPARALSLLSPGDDFPMLAGLDDPRHLRLHMHDIRGDAEGFVSPGRAHVAEIVEFLSDHDPDEVLLVHCFAGISRSTATAFVAACLFNPQSDEADVARALRDASPTAFPNTRIVAFADDLMGRGGRMRAAIEGMGRGMIAETAEPFSIPARM